MLLIAAQLVCKHATRHEPTSLTKALKESWPRGARPNDSSVYIYIYVYILCVYIYMYIYVYIYIYLYIHLYTNNIYGIYNIYIIYII